MKLIKRRVLRIALQLPLPGVRAAVEGGDPAAGPGATRLAPAHLCRRLHETCETVSVRTAAAGEVPRQHQCLCLSVSHRTGAGILSSMILTCMA